MTTFERFERGIPQLMDELASPQLPDYLDDMLRRTEQTTQRPAWSALERWLPMGVIARTRTMPTVPIRPILALALILIVAVAGAVLMVGSQRRLPPPFGPARNGLVLYEDVSGGVRSYDPVTGAITELELGPGQPAAPWFTNDGTRFVFDMSGTSPNGLRALYLANADGSGAHEVARPGASITSVAWLPVDDRILLAREGDPMGRITAIDTKSGASSTLNLNRDVSGFASRPGTNQLILGADHALYRVNADGSDPQPIVAADGLLDEQFSVSPDGKSVVYATWTDTAKGRLHIVDIDTSVELDHGFYDARPYMDLAPTFSPDGRSIIVERYDDAGNYRPTIVPLDGGSPMPLGRSHPQLTNGSLKAFSPDGTQVLVTYQDDGTTWLYDVATGEGRQLDIPVALGTEPTWQRLAP